MVENSLKLSVRMAENPDVSSIAPWKKLQSGLGNLNDMRVHLQQAHDFARSSPAAQKAFAIGCLIGREEGTANDVLAEVVAAGKRLRKAA